MSKQINIELENGKNIYLVNRDKEIEITIREEIDEVAGTEETVYIPKENLKELIKGLQSF